MDRSLILLITPKRPGRGRDMIKKMNILILCMFFLVVSENAAVSEDLKKKVRHITAEQALYLHNAGKILLLDVHKGVKYKKIIGAYEINPGILYRKNTKLKISKTRLIGVF